LYSIEQTADGGYILGGDSRSNISGDKTENSDGYHDYWIVKTDSLGNTQWQYTIGGNSGDYLSEVQQTTDGGYILGGTSGSGISGDKTESNNGQMDYWIIKLAPDTITSVFNVKHASDILIYPNPATSLVTIDSKQAAITKVEVYDVLGQLQTSTQVSLAKRHTASIDLSKLSSGIYFVRITTGNGVVTKKVVME
jgi:hypothetical protein